MLKKFILASSILALTSGVAMAAAPYVGASLGVVTNTSTNGGNGQAGFFTGMPFTLFAGYGGLVNQNFYLAGELFGTLGTGDISSKNGLKTSYGYGASVLPGVMLSDHTLAFARAGVVRSEFTSQDAMSTGAQVGLGLQTSLTQNLDVRGEYDRNLFRSVHNLNSPRSDAFNAGLVYKFD